MHSKECGLPCRDEDSPVSSHPNISPRFHLQFVSNVRKILLERLLSSKDETAANIVESGGFEWILECARAYPKDEVILENLFRLLENIASAVVTSESKKRYRLKGPTLLLQTLEGNHALMELCKVGLKALDALMENAKMRKELIKAGGVHVLIKCLSAHKDCNDILTTVFSFLEKCCSEGASGSDEQNFESERCFTAEGVCDIVSENCFGTISQLGMKSTSESLLHASMALALALSAQGRTSQEAVLEY